MDDAREKHADLERRQQRLQGSLEKATEQCRGLQHDAHHAQAQLEEAHKDHADKVMQYHTHDGGSQLRVAYEIRMPSPRRGPTPLLRLTTAA